MSDWVDVPLDDESDWADVDHTNIVEAGKASKVESGLRGAAQGASLGFADEISGAVESLFSDKTYDQARDESRDNFRKAKEDNPKSFMAGEIGGGLATAVVPVGTAANLSRAALIGAGVGGVAGLGNSESEDVVGMAKDAGTGALVGGAIGAGGRVAGEALSKVGTKLTRDVGPAISKMLPIGKKSNADEIEAAAKVLGIKATPGMTNASETVQKLESSLHQSPTIGGWLTRRATKPVNKSMQEATEELVSDAATVSPFESGEQVKKILANEIDAKFAPSKSTFQDLAKYTKDIPSTPNSVKAVARNIMQIPEVETLELPLARQVVRQLEKNPSVDQIKTLRTMVGKKAKSAADGAEKSAYWQMYAKLGRLEENTLKRGVISSARTGPEGNKIASGMLDQLKGAKKGYAEQMGNLEELSTAARMGQVGSPSTFIDKIDAIPSERLQEKLLPLEDVRLSQTVQKQFPEAFGGLRRARIRDLSEGIVSDGEYLPGKFLQKTKGLNPEAQTMLFGDKSGKLDALRTVNQSLPEKVGPSGTQQAFSIKDFLNPVEQAKDLARFGVYKYSSSDKLSGLANFLSSKPAFKNMAEQNPRAFQAAVYDLSKRLSPEQALPKVAGPGQQPVDEDKAREAFLDNN